MSMNNLIVSILDLSEEILFTIFKKLNNIDLLCSLVGINQKLDKVVCDINFTQAVDITQQRCPSRLNIRRCRAATVIKKCEPRRCRDGDFGNL